MVSGNYTQLVDLFSLGSVLFETVFQKNLYEALYSVTNMHDIISELKIIVKENSNQHQNDINFELADRFRNEEKEAESVEVNKKKISDDARKAYENDYSDKPEFEHEDFPFMLLALLQVIFFCYILCYFI